MKSKIYFLAALVCVSLAVSCDKNAAQKKLQEDLQQPSNALNAIRTAFADDEFSDFNFMVATVHADALLQADEIANTQVCIQAFSKTQNNVGDLAVNGAKIPFTQQTYFANFNPPIRTWDFNAKDLNISLSGSGGFPALNFTEYSPSVADMTLDGLVDQNKVDLDAGVVLNWNTDQRNDNPVVVVIEGTEGEEGTKDPITTVITPKELDGHFQIDPGTLSKYANCPSIKVYFARGVDKELDISGQKVSFTVINYAWSRLYNSKL